MTDRVADAPQRQQQARIGQDVGDHDPLDVGDRQVERLRDGGEGDVDRRVKLRR